MPARVLEEVQEASRRSVHSSLCGVQASPHLSSHSLATKSPVVACRNSPMYSS